MNALERIKLRIKHLYETNPQIHVNISRTHPKLDLKNDPAVITGVYPHVFRIEEYSTGEAQSHTLQYTEIFTKQLEIVEIGEV